VVTPAPGAGLSAVTGAVAPERRIVAQAAVTRQTDWKHLQRLKAFNEAIGVSTVGCPLCRQ
jgi:hypothetical protein